MNGDTVNLEESISLNDLDRHALNNHLSKLILLSELLCKKNEITDLENPEINAIVCRIKTTVFEFAELLSADT